jgi:tetratricopeptide (TPR) repeat protein
MQILHGIAYELIDSGFKEKNRAKKQEYFLQALLACMLSAAYEPKYEYAYNKMGECLILLERHKEAVNAFKRARDINPQNPFSYYGLGRSYSALDMKEEAIHAYRQYLLLADEETEMKFIMEADEKIQELSKE